MDSLIFDLKTKQTVASCFACKSDGLLLLKWTDFDQKKQQLEPDMLQVCISILHKEICQATKQA